MKIQGILDLSGFELQNFCIQNYTDKENVANIARGRKFFFTGNSTDQDYNREVIWDGGKWRTAAYLDDIDKINEKLDLVFGEELDTDTIIDSWKEVQDFLSGIENTKNLMTMLDGKLDRTGGAMKGTGSYVQEVLSIDTDNEFYTIFSVKNQGNLKGRLEWTPDTSSGASVAGFGLYNATTRERLHLSDNGGVFLGINPLLHAGNVGDYTAGAAKKLAPFYGSIMRPTSADVEPLNDGSVYAFMATSTMTVGKPAYDGFILNFEWDNSGYMSQLFLGNGSVSANDPYKRMQARFATLNGWSDWKTVAFTDSTVDKAKQFAEPVTLWGNTFDGTQDLSDGIKISNESGLYFKNSANTKDILSAFIDKSNRLFFGMGALTNDMPTYLLGKTLCFQVGSSYITAMTINEDGHILINAGDNGANLSVFGGANIQIGWPSINAISGIGWGNTFSITRGKDAPASGVYIWSESSGIGAIQASGAPGSNVAYALNLNPFGGAVNVGGNLAPNANNSLSLGSSSYRWSDVYSVGGNFSGRVLIGGVADDGESALQVNKTMSIGASKTDFGLRFNRNTIYAWIPENHAYGHNAQFGLKVGDALLGVFGHHREANGDYYAFIGTSHSSPWFAINSTESFFNVATTFNRGALIPTGQKLTIGDATIEYDSNAKAIKVDGNMYTTGTNASGGVADAQQGGTGGDAEVYKYDLEEGEQSYDVQNVKGDVNVNVQVYEWNGNSSSWDMILTDVSVTDNTITVTFGRPTSVPHMVTVV